MNQKFFARPIRPILAPTEKHESDSELERVVVHMIMSCRNLLSPSKDQSETAASLRTQPNLMREEILAQEHDAEFAWRCNGQLIAAQAGFRED